MFIVFSSFYLSKSLFIAQDLAKIFSILFFHNIELCYNTVIFHISLFKKKKKKAKYQAEVRFGRKGRKRHNTILAPKALSDPSWGAFYSSPSLQTHWALVHTHLGSAGPQGLCVHQFLCLQSVSFTHTHTHTHVLLLLVNDVLAQLSPLQGCY